MEVYKSPVCVRNSFSNDSVFLINEGITQPLIGEERRRKLIDKVNEIDFEVGKQDLYSLLTDFSDVIAVSGDSLGHTKVLKNKINLQENVNAAVNAAVNYMLISF